MPADMITVAVDDEFAISLESITTAGYVWKIESIPDTIKLLGTEKTGREARPGDSTNQIFRFRAHKTGEYQVKFTLSRPWEHKAIESRTVTVKVKLS